MSEQLNNPVNDSIPIPHLAISILPSVSLKCESEDIIESEKVMKEKTLAITKFPPWVEMYRVKKIRDLACLETVREMILSGMPLVEIGRQIQALGELTNMALDSIQVYLNHYKATLPTWLIASRQQPKQFLELKKATEATVDVLKELNGMYLWTKERLEMGMNQERRFGVLNAGLDKSFMVASHLLEQIDELKDRLGVQGDSSTSSLPKHLSDQVDWSRIYARESVQRVMSNPEKRSRVVQVAERLLDMYSTKLTPEQLEKKNKE